MSCPAACWETMPAAAASSAVSAPPKPKPCPTLAKEAGSPVRLAIWLCAGVLFTVTLNSTPAHSQIANRTGLPASFASVGQGFGFGGALTAEDAAAAGIVSQQAAGQDISTSDHNQFGVLNW